jgi:hypothetical protein
LGREGYKKGILKNREREKERKRGAYNFGVFFIYAPPSVSP